MQEKMRKCEPFRENFSKPDHMHPSGNTSVRQNLFMMQLIESTVHSK